MWNYCKNNPIDKSALPFYNKFMNNKQMSCAIMRNNTMLGRAKMRKKLSVGKRMLAFVLAFAMIFTAISWGDAREVKAEEKKSEVMTENFESGEWKIKFNSEVASCKTVSLGEDETDDNHVMEITYSDGGNAYIYTKDGISVQQGHVYTIKGKVKQSTSKSCTVFKGTGMTGGDMCPQWAGSAWEEFEYTYTATTTATDSVWLGFGIWAEAGAVLYMDDLEVTDTWEEADSEETDSNVVVEEIPCYQYDFSDDGADFYNGKWNVSWTGVDAGWDNANGYYDNIEGGKKNYWINGRSEAGTTPVGTMTRTISDLPAGDYKLYFSVEGQNVYAEVSLSADGTDPVKAEEQIGDWKSMDATNVGSITITEGSSLSITFKATLSNQWNTGIKFGNIRLVQVKEVSKEEKVAKRSELQTLYDANKGTEYKNKGYTSASVRAFESAIGMAEKVLGNANATLLELTTAYNTLNSVVTAGFENYGEIIVNKIEDYDDTSAIRGADVSTYIALMEAFKELNKDIPLDSDKYGFRDWDGNLLDEQGFFDFIAGEGVNYIRTRVWNDPYNDSEKTKGYGGGNNDLAKAIEIGKLATNAGMKNLIDFHLSDFWADPERQHAPKAWKDFTADQKAVAAKEYILDALNQLKAAGVNVGMVQIGNETNPGIADEGWGGNAEKIIAAGCAAVDEFNQANGTSIKKVVHFTSPNSSDDMYQFAKYLKDVNYDIFATSYYPSIHGGIENLKTVLATIADEYGKYVMVAETSWATSTFDADGAGNGKTENEELGYGMSVQWQAHEIRDVMDAVNSIDVEIHGNKAGLGMFYWELAWLPVMEGSVRNQELWHKYGVGWASSNAKDYDGEKVDGDGGNPNDNQILFDPYGNPLLSLKVFGNVKNGIETSNRVFAKVEVAPITIHVTDSFGTNTLPNEATAIYSDRSTKKTAVTYNTEDVQALQRIIDSNDSIGNHVIHGTTVVDGTTYDVTCTVTVDPVNILKEGSFETKTSDWLYSDTDIIKRKPGDNPRTGNWASNYYSETSDFTFVLSQSAIVSKTGTYSTYAYTQGEKNERENSGIKIIVTSSSGKVYESDLVKTTGWNEWKKIEIKNMELTAGDTVIYEIVSGPMEAKMWGSIDDVYLYLDPAEKEPVVVPPSSSSSDSSSTPSTPTDDKTDTADNTTTTKNPDGTTTETKTETTTNESGKEVATTVTTNKDADGNVTGSTEVSKIANVAKNTEVTVTVEKDAKGEVSNATAEVTKKGTETENGTKGTISAAVVAQIKEAAGSKDVAITTSVTGADGKEKYSVTVDANDLVAGAKLTVVVKDSKTGKAVLVDAKQVKVSSKGNVSVVLPEGNDYTLIDAKEAAKVTKEILKTVVPAKTSATLKAGKSNTAKLSTKLDMDNVKKITYTSSKKGVVTVNKNGKVVAKKAGTATITIKVTLNNGKTKTVKMKYKVK